MAAQSTLTTAARRLCEAIAARDVDGIAAQFAAGYVNETPAHPSRGFRGADQVRQNWSRILGAVPDLHVELVRESVVGDVEWSEWSYTGTAADGSPFDMAGVVIFGVGDDGAVMWARFYLEPVDASLASATASTIEEAVGQHVGAP